MKKYNWKKAAAWICTLTLLTGTLSLSSFGEIGPGAALSETIAGTVAAAAEAVGTAVGTVADTVGDVFMRGPGTASASDASGPSLRDAGAKEAKDRASSSNASDSNATDSDASQFDEEGILIDGIALIDDVSTPSEVMLAMPMLMAPPADPVPADLQGLFEAMAAACESWNGEYTVYVSDLAKYGIKAETAEDLGKIYEAFFNTCPEYFFLDHNAPGAGSYGLEEETSYLNWIELPVLTDEFSEEYVSEFKNKIHSILNDPDYPAGASPALQALYLHDWICENSEYKSSADSSYNENRYLYSAYAPLFYGTGACQGYALAYKCLLDAANIESYLVWSKEKKHSWNLVNTGSGWLYVDCTQDDPTSMYEHYFDHEFFLRSETSLPSGTYGAYDGWTMETMELVKDSGITAGSEDIMDRFWENAVGKIPAIDGRWYYVDSKDPNVVVGSGDGFTRVRYYEEAGGEKGILSSTMIPGRWMINTSSFHSVSYAQLAVYDGKLYVSAMDGIWKVNPTPGTEGSAPVLIYELQDHEKARGSVCGTRLFGSSLYYDVCRISGSGNSVSFERKQSPEECIELGESLSFTLDYYSFDLFTGAPGVKVTASRNDGKPITAGMRVMPAGTVSARPAIICIFPRLPN